MTLPTQSALRTHRHRAAFTIIELMVSIGIIGVLISLIFAVLMSTKARAGEVKSLSNARGVSMSMQAFADTYGRWPFAMAGKRTPGVATPSALPSGLMVVPTWPPGAFIGVSDHWALSRLWPGLVALVAQWEENFETWVSPGTERATLASLNEGGYLIGSAVSYVYSNSFVGSPALWREGSTPDDSLIAPTTPSMVDHPSNKVLVWDGDLAYLPRRPQQVDRLFAHITPMAFADQHADMRNPLDATPGVANPLNGGNATRLHNTPAGVLGRDY